MTYLITLIVAYCSIVYELLWFISGNTNIKYLQDRGVRIWNEWVTEDGNAGPIYGHQWRKFGSDWYTGVKGVDQLAKIIQQIKDNPYSRRHVISAWNPLQIDEMSLPPCHYAYQFYVNEGKISCLSVMRSVDCFLGLPFNIGSYALLLMMIAQCTDLVPHELVFQLGDTHIYNNHIDKVKLQLTREPKELPRVILNPEIKCIDDFKYEDFKLVGYDPHPPIKAKVSV